MYYVHFEMMIRNRKNFPWKKIITHRFTLDQCKEALKKAYEPDAIKVVFTA
jgi:threonine dehydrogenase-like Zn-dependent dehydrogenase